MWADRYLEVAWRTLHNACGLQPATERLATERAQSAAARATERAQSVAARKQARWQADFPMATRYEL